MAKVAVLDIKGSEKSSIDLPEEVFGGRINTDVIHQAVVKYQASLRQGNASTKERADVSGGGKKPYKQKGTGRARAGSSRSPLWTGGGVTFGPHPRDFSYSIPKKIRRAALKEALKVKIKDQNLHCLDDLKDSIEKTKEFAAILKNLKLSGRILAVLDGSNENISRVSRNIPYFELKRAEDVNAYDVMRYKNLLITKTGLTKLIERMTK
jgi:large subunit ribosomal protein L4